ncbi:hypothetical protein RN629_08775 [Sphingomonadaceae bacterium jetA1]|uniref:hypothetical protein n=1 Tax=Facivitalis istanbulensis TaxID=3075838 RepID=UPI00347761A6
MGNTPPIPMRRPTRSFWLSQPGRLTGLSPMMARAVLVLVLLLCAIMLMTPAPVDPMQDRLALVSATIVDHLRHGQSFYPAAFDALRENARPLRPALLAVPLPALPVLVAKVPPILAQAVLIALTIGVLIGWARRFRPVLERSGPRTLALTLLISGLYPLVTPAMVTVPEVWAGVVIALSLVQRRPDAESTAVALGFIAMILSPVAMVHALVMLILAVRARARREMLGWIVAIGLFLLALAAHAQALNTMTSAIDPAIALPGAALSPGALVATIGSAQILGRLPFWLVVPLTLIAALGWMHWRQPVARRASPTLAAYALLLMLTDAGGLLPLVSPLFFLGVVFAPDAIHDLLVAARDRRRITVTRVVR